MIPHFMGGINKLLFIGKRNFTIAKYDSDYKLKSTEFYIKSEITNIGKSFCNDLNIKTFDKTAQPQYFVSGKEYLKSGLYNKTPIRTDRIEP